jgi:hypothetical protein
MFERWRQENFFKYMREEFLLDAPSGEFFCSEFCAEDAEEAAFQARRKALSQSP